MDQNSLPNSEWIKARIAEEPYWFHRLGLPDGIVTPGWSDPSVDKLPHFGLPADMSGCACWTSATLKASFPLKQNGEAQPRSSASKTIRPWPASSKSAGPRSGHGRALTC